MNDFKVSSVSYCSPHICFILSLQIGSLQIVGNMAAKNSKISLGSYRVSYHKGIDYHGPMLKQLKEGRVLSLVPIPVPIKEA